MANVNDVASFFIEWANNSEEEHMTNLWLNKLMFFAQGEYLARHGEKLFPEEIEAWQYGPVIPCIYRKYQVCGRSPIQMVDEGYDSSVFNRSERDLLVDVLREYGRYNAGALVQMTHAAGTPWKNVYIEGANAVITADAMKAFFVKNPIPTFESLFSELDFEEVGRRDEDGYFVLPADDEENGWDEL